MVNCEFLRGLKLGKLAVAMLRVQSSLAGRRSRMQIRYLNSLLRITMQMFAGGFSCLKDPRNYLLEGV